MLTCYTNLGMDGFVPVGDKSEMLCDTQDEKSMLRCKQHATTNNNEKECIQRSDQKIDA